MNSGHYQNDRVSYYVMWKHWQFFFLEKKRKKNVHLSKHLWLTIIRMFYTVTWWVWSKHASIHILTLHSKTHHFEPFRNRFQNDRWQKPSRRSGERHPHPFTTLQSLSFSQTNEQKHTWRVNAREIRMAVDFLLDVGWEVDIAYIVQNDAGDVFWFGNEKWVVHWTHATTTHTQTHIHTCVYASWHTHTQHKTKQMKWSFSVVKPITITRTHSHSWLVESTKIFSA